MFAPLFPFKIIQCIIVIAIAIAIPSLHRLSTTMTPRHQEEVDLHPYFSSLSFFYGFRIFDNLNFVVLKTLDFEDSSYLISALPNLLYLKKPPEPTICRDALPAGSPSLLATTSFTPFPRAFFAHQPCSVCLRRQPSRIVDSSRSSNRFEFCYTDSCFSVRTLANVICDP